MRELTPIFLRELTPIFLPQYFPRTDPNISKNWLFCWSEVGAEQVGVIQSLLTTCRLQGVNPYTYLVDVLQRISLHPDRQILDLTPRVWKEKFADSPLVSDLVMVRQ